MRPPEAVSAFVREALGRGASPDAIARALREAGWSAPEVRAGLAAWQASGNLPPVPRPRAAGSPAEALAHLVLFVALGVVLANLWVVGTALIDRFVPDALDPPRWNAGSGVRWAVAGLVAAWPLWAWMTLRLARLEAADPGRRRSAVGRWLTAGALFLAAVTLLADAVAVLAWYLNGELTARFLAKAALVAALAGSVFLLYRGGLAEEAA